MTNAEKLKKLETIIEKYGLNALPTTDVARQIHAELTAVELMYVLDRPAVFDTNLLKSIKMNVAEFREAQKQALFLHVLLEAEPMIKPSNANNS